MRVLVVPDAFKAVSARAVGGRTVATTGSTGST
jgi:hypothetical protein